jgi:hypothetical protein
MALFGWDRFNSRLSVNYRPLKTGEIEEEVKRYDDYYKNFSLREASLPVISFVVVPNEMNLNLSNLQLWYELSEGENFGKYTLYKAKLKATGQ